MRTRYLLILILLNTGTVFAQSETAIEQYQFIGNDDTYVMPVVHYQNKKNWYAEARYNYEDARTFSLYLGKTFSSDKKFTYSITPLIGGIVGGFNGISTGLNMDFEYQQFSFSSQSQYSFSTDTRTSNFFYNWSELYYQPLKWMYAGFSLQQTNTYQTAGEFEPGILLGLTFKNYSFPFYSFSPTSKDRYFIVGVNVELQNSSKRKSNSNKNALTGNN